MSQGPTRFVPISFKLSFLILGILALATAPIIFESANYLESMSFERERQHLVEKVFAKADSVETLMWSYINLVEDTVSHSHAVVRGQRKRTSLRDELQAIQIWDGERTTLESSIINSANTKRAKAIAKFASQVETNRLLSFHGVMKGEHLVQNIKIGGFPTLVVATPVKGLKRAARSNKIAIGYFRIDRLLNLVKKDSGSIVAVLDQQFKILAHPDESQIQNSRIQESIRSYAERGKHKQSHFGHFVDGEGLENEAMVAWVRLPQGLTVTAATPTALARVPILKVKQRSIYLVVSVFAMALGVIFFFSNSLTVPLQKLLELTRQVAKGNFSVRAGASVRSRDEVGLLAQAFDSMAEDLEKGKKVRSAFDKLHGDDVAEELIKTELRRGGVRREATLLFCDIRNFTKFSENSPPEEVVQLLNEFFDSMVKVIRSNQGTVDKFLGDGIMAVWGIHSHSPKNPQFATKAALEMRIALKKFNRARARIGKDPIDIGMGIHCGPVVVGVVGSEERMEFTVVGDTVNTAARIEAVTKAQGTDLLISKSVANALEDMFIYRESGELQLKGKAVKVSLLEVDGYYDRSSQPVIVKNGHDKNAA